MLVLDISYTICVSNIIHYYCANRNSDLIKVVWMLDWIACLLIKLHIMIQSMALYCCMCLFSDMICYAREFICTFISIYSDFNTVFNRIMNAWFKIHNIILHTHTHLWKFIKYDLNEWIQYWRKGNDVKILKKLGIFSFYLYKFRKWYPIICFYIKYFFVPYKTIYLRNKFWAYFQF